MTQRAQHECSARGCEAIIAASKLMCSQHWRLVPFGIQRKVLAAWRNYQAAVQRDDGWENVIGVADLLRDAQREAIDAVAAAEGGAQ